MGSIGRSSCLTCEYCPRSVPRYILPVFIRSGVKANMRTGQVSRRSAAAEALAPGSVMRPDHGFEDVIKACESHFWPICTAI
jgi:hypothetical protein